MVEQAENVKILVVDDEPDITHLFENFLLDLGYNVKTATRPEDAIKIFDDDEIDIAVLDINMPRISGMELLQQFLEKNPETIVIMVSAIQDTDIVVKCIQQGAYDYLAKPLIDLNQLQIRITRGLAEKKIRSENKALKKELNRHTDFLEMKSKSPVMMKVLEKIRTVAEYNTTVLLTGDSGTGKEVAARLLHKSSDRAKKPFIPINCGSVPATLFESTLFGHEKGSFTGATEKKKGVFEESHTGTIFLDEITETSMEFQIQLLRVLETSTIRPVGGNVEKKLDLRVVAASNQDIQQMVADGKFREDLYFRLNVFHVDIPTLMERMEDLPTIIEYHLKRLSSKMGKKVTSVSPEVYKLFQDYSWPGNIREVVNILENSMIMARGESIQVSDLPPTFNPEAHPASEILRSAEDLPDYSDAKENFERNYFRNLLNAHDSNISRASQAAGLSRQHLHLKLKQLGLQG